MTTTGPTLDQAFPLATAGALPSSRTFGMTADALASEDIEEVKLQLVHVWLHYQSLEFTLNQAAQPELIFRITENAALAFPDVNPVEVAVRYLSVEGTRAAYDTAHYAMSDPAALADPQQALRTLYYQLNHADPERELTDAQLARFFTDTDGETEEAGQ